MQVLTRDTPGMKWELAPEFPGDVKVKTLRKVDERGARTILVRLDPGTRIVPHSHLGVVQHFLLAGGYLSGGKEYRTGAYRFFTRYDEVPEIRTRKGATILMIYDPVAT